MINEELVVVVILKLQWCLGMEFVSVIDAAIKCSITWLHHLATIILVFHYIINQIALVVSQGPIATKPHSRYPS